MKIRKLFKFEMAHIVRNAWSRRCSRNIHGHSYEVELFITGEGLDNGQMVIDFGLVKHWMNDFFDSFDHSFMLWNLPNDKDVIKMACENFERVIVTPFNSSAEMQSKFFSEICNILLEEYKKKYTMPMMNGIDVSSVKISNVKVHETRTGYADYSLDEGQQSFPKTVYPIKIFTPDMSENVVADKNTIWISEQIAQEWKSDEWVEVYNSSIM